MVMYMLISFKVENYKSFGTEQSLQMTAGPVRTHSDQLVEFDDVRILTSALVFGANASGKTNLIRAISDSRRMVVEGWKPAPNQYCRTMPGASDRTTGFEYTIRIGDAVYVYGFEILLRDGTFRREWLTRMTSPDRGVKVFDMDGGSVVTEESLSAHDRRTFDVYRAEVGKTGGMLLRALSRGSYGGDSRLSCVETVRRWFEKNLIVIFANSVRTSETGSDIELLGRMMRSYATGATSVDFDRVEEEGLLIQGNLEGLGPDSVINIRNRADLLRIRRGDDGPIVERIVFRHGEAAFQFGEESAGTRRLFDLAPILNRDSGDDLTYVIDEMDHNLHPQLSRRFLRDFYRIAADHRRQLIATVHESRLMDLELLRRDELMIVNMRPVTGSEIYSIEDFGVRGDLRVDRAYLDGRFGGVPWFTELFPGPDDGKSRRNGERMAQGSPPALRPGGPLTPACRAAWSTPCTPPCTGTSP